MAGGFGVDSQQPENAATQPRVTDNPRASRYELWLGATRAVGYRSEPGVVVLVHTEVDPAFAGQGLGERLVAGGLEDLRARGSSSSPCVGSSVPTWATTPTRLTWSLMTRPSPVTMGAPAADNRLGRALWGPGGDRVLGPGPLAPRRRVRPRAAPGVRPNPPALDPRRRGRCPGPWPRSSAVAPPAPSTTACWQQNPRNRPLRPASPLTPRGPLLVRGDLHLDTPDGARDETRAALCGRGQNRPFCDGACGVNSNTQAAPGTRRRHPPEALNQRRCRHIAAAQLGGRPSGGRMVRELLEAQRREIVLLRSQGEISNEVMRRIERDLDLEDARLEI
jgi:predicted GNAT family acetyltransferase